MAFPAPAAHGQQQVKEAGGQPLPYGSIPEGTFLVRSGNNIVGTGSGVTAAIRFDSFEIKNQSTGKYTRYKCRDDGMGNSELYIDAEDLT